MRRIFLCGSLLLTALSSGNAMSAIQSCKDGDTVTLAGTGYLCTPYLEGPWRYTTWWDAAVQTRFSSLSLSDALAQTKTSIEILVKSWGATNYIEYGATSAFVLDPRTELFQTAQQPTQMYWRGVLDRGTQSPINILARMQVSCPAGYFLVDREPFQGDLPMCLTTARCPVPPLQAITDPTALDHENGKYARSPDLDHVTDALRAGAACIIQRAAGSQASARVTSGFRPPAYQAHLREVWDKWHLLVNNAQEICRQTKEDVRSHWVKHALVRQPVQNSNHSSGKAVDVAGVPSAIADAIAAQCSMFRPEPTNDPVHFQPR